MDLRKNIVVLLTLALMLSTFYTSNTRSALQVSGRITNETAGRIVEVFDADAIAVRLNNGQIAYVKLLGIKADTRSGGLKYMQDNAFGRNVILYPDFTGAVSEMDGRWNLMYVYLISGSMTDLRLENCLNLSLIRFGYAEVDESYSSISQYAAFQSEQRKAKASNLGMWGDGQQGYYASSDRININTASKSAFETYLVGKYDDSVITNILGYRSYATFGTVEELKFVKGMTRELFGSNRRQFSVITNINTATEKELRTLTYYDISDIDSIIKYRSSHKFNSLTDLYREAGVPRDFYDTNQYYMSVDDETKMIYAKPNKVVNINTASQSQLSDISDVGSNLAGRIVNARRNGYTLKTLMELKGISNISTEGVHRLSDNCHIYTDVNSASVNELESLFGSSYMSSEINKIIDLREISNVSRLKNVLSDDRYDRIVNFIYAKELALPERVNLNTASESQLREAGVPYSDALSIISMRGGMMSASEIPVNVSAYDKSVALYTNINTASVRELRSLNVFSESAISLIISNRDDQPFGSDEELEAFFEENKMLSAYNSVRDFIVVR